MFAFSIEFASLCKENNSPLSLLLKKCKPSYFIGCGYLNLSATLLIFYYTDHMI
jgi:hypothetical protein